MASANPNTVVVLETGAPVLTPWRESVNALLETWYPGEDGGTAIAHVLFGDADPGGRLPATFPKSEADLPTAAGGMAAYPGTVNPEENCELHSSVPCPYYEEYYSEGVFEGYRWYDSQNIAPAFPFGFGLSYTHFTYSKLTITPGSGSEPSATVSLTVKNTGTRSGWAVPEVYSSLPSLPGAPQPPLQLKGFSKLVLAPGQSQLVSVPLNAHAFSYWSEAEGGWRVDPGCDGILVGGSSAELPLHGAIAEGGVRCQPKFRQEFSCKQVTFKFSGFPNLPGNTVHEAIYADGVQIYKGEFKFNGSTGENTVVINLAPGRHANIDVRARWNTNGFKGGEDHPIGKATC